MAGEFDLIDRIFRPLATASPHVVRGIGDDCALVTVPPGQALAVTTDTVVEGIHFPSATAAGDVGWKALACSLSDLAAVGAEPAWVTLSLILPRADEDWLKCLASGFLELAEQHRIPLVGGDLVRGPVTAATVQAAGHVPAGEFLGRDGARPGDGIHVSGWPGEAAAALAQLRQGLQPALRARLDRPEPRMALGRFIRGRASACIDVSDGLAADLGHVLRASGVGARIELDSLPISPGLRAAGSLDQIHDWILRGGDDYELCFTVPAEKEHIFNEMPDTFPVITQIGAIESEPGLRLIDGAGEARDLPWSGHDHFREDGSA